jgi:TrmH family RNA methyltransferase
MLSKKEIKDIQSLSQKKFREELKLYLAEGPKTVNELLQIIPEKIKQVYATDKWMQENKASHMLPVTQVTVAELEQLSQLKTPNQVLAIVQQEEEKEPDADGFILYLDTIQDPGNFGTIIRIADWFDINKVVCSAGCADVYNPKVVQSTMASIARVHVYYDHKGNWLEGRKVPVFAATLDGKSIYQTSLTGAGILLIGNESRGISDSVLQYASEKITIPKKGGAESLNAAVATGIILSHLLN